MLLKHLAWAAVGATLVAAPVLAQTNPPAANPPAATPPAASQPATATPPAGSANWMTQMQPGMWRASKLEGLDVYNNNDEKIGDIRELLVDSSGNIKAVIIGVGGFLGIGEHDVAVPLDQVKFMNEARASRTAAANPGATTTAPPASTNPPANPAANNPGAANTTGSVTTASNDADRGAPDHAVVNMNKDQLKAAPEFKYSR